jgi:hypothetical protein
MRWSNHPPLQHWFALVELWAANRGDAFHAMGRISHLTSNDEIIGLPAEHQFVATGGKQKLRVFRAQHYHHSVIA